MTDYSTLLATLMDADPQEAKRAIVEWYGSQTRDDFLEPRVKLLSCGVLGEEELHRAGTGENDLSSVREFQEEPSFGASINITCQGATNFYSISGDLHIKPVSDEPYPTVHGDSSCCGEAAATADDPSVEALAHPQVIHSSAAGGSKEGA